MVEPGPDDLMAWIYGYLAGATLIVFATFGAFSGRLIDALRAAAIRDGLTSLYNRRFFNASLPGVRATCRRRGTPLSVLMLDLDLFKRVNDRYGHAVGDQTLRAVARALERSVRGSDLLVRFGGEEFAVACPDTDARLAAEIGERIRAEVAALDPRQLGHPGPQTISVGVATMDADADESIEQLLRRADDALYEAKQAGRNRVAVAAAAAP
jgi:two-component system cell cycle response regulator